MRKICAVAVIGHVDHGKTSLVRALTGIETDRLKEERERGLSITLGFASCVYTSATVDLIDTPGHEDFVRAMAAGASGVRAALLVVSAVDGFRRQTVEHLDIARLLGVSCGVVAVTKSDLLATEDRVHKLQAIEGALAGTALAGQPIVFCSSLTGDGLDRLNCELSVLAERAPAPSRLPGFFLPVDRVFNVQGVGAVATGTLLGGELALGAAAQVAPHGRSGVVRRLQARGKECDHIAPGGRAAVNLRGVALEDVRPGDVICTPTSFASSDQLDVEVALLSSADRPVKHMEEVRVLMGTRSSTATVRLFGAKRVDPGCVGLARLAFASPTIAHAGQRGVLRQLSPAATIGSVVVLDPKAPSLRTPARVAILEAATTGDAVRIARALAERDRGVVNLSEAARLARCSLEELAVRLVGEFGVPVDGWATSFGALERARAAYREALGAAHAQTRARSAVPLGAVREAAADRVAQALVELAEQSLIETGEIVILEGEVALVGHDPITSLDDLQRDALFSIEARLREQGAKPPSIEDLATINPDALLLLNLLVKAGRVVKLENYALRQTVAFHADALRQAFESLRANFPPPRPFKTGEAREALGTSRKFIVPLLEHFDLLGLTIRDDDVRRVVDPPSGLGDI